MVDEYQLLRLRWFCSDGLHSGASGQHNYFHNLNSYFWRIVNSINLSVLEIAYFTYCVGYLVAFASGTFKSFKTYAQTYIQLKKSIENKTDEEVTEYLKIQKYDQLNPKAQQLMMQQVRQIRGTIIPYVL